MASRFLIPFGSRSLAGGADPFISLHREMNRLFDDTFRGMDQREGGRGQFLAPSLDVHESGDGFCVTADLPGVSPEDIDLQVEGDLLTICGESKREQERDDKGYHVMERSSGSFRRSLRLPFEPDPDQVKAECRNGVLTVHIPKAGQQQRSRKIAVGGGGAGQQQVEGRSWAANDERGEDRQMAASQGLQRQEGGSDDTGAPQAGENKNDVTTGGGV
jgi:HSP20 family protein